MSQIIKASSGSVGPTSPAIAFFAFVSTPQVNVTGASNQYTILFDSTTRNNGSSYNPATGTFTAPQTGFYNFAANIELNATAFDANTRFLITAVKNGSQTIVISGGQCNSFIFSISLSKTLQGVGAWMMQLNAGDTLNILVTQDNVAQNVSVAGNSSFLTNFSGFFVGS